MGDLFLAIVESKPTETETFDRRSIVIFRENLQEFLKSFEKALEAMDKVPMKRPSKRSERHVSDSPSDRHSGSAEGGRRSADGSHGSSDRSHGSSDRSHGPSDRGHSPSERSKSGSTDRRVDRRPTGLPPVPPAPRQRRSDVEGTFSLLPEAGSSSGKSSGKIASKPGKRVVRPRSAEAERMVPRPPAEDPDAKPARRVTVKRAKPKD